MQFHLQPHKKNNIVGNKINKLYTKNYKTASEESKDLNTQKDILCLQIGRLHIVKMQYYPKQINRFKSQWLFFFLRNRKAGPKMYMELQGTLNSQNNPE